MIITHHGVGFFKVSFGEITLAINPVSKESKHKSSRFGADITLISTNNIDHNGSENTSRGEKESFVISGPGEYEVSGIFIKGYQTKTFYDNKESLNTIYTVSMEGMNLCFLGALGEDTLNSEAKKATESCDILFVPIGGEGVLDPATAQKIAVQFEPKIIIPSHFSDIGEKDSLNKFIKESGSEKSKPVDKLTIKKKDIENLDSEVVILEAQN